MKKRKLIANNKKARHDYFVEDTYEAGIVLTGTEIKSASRHERERCFRRYIRHGQRWRSLNEQKAVHLRVFSLFV